MRVGIKLFPVLICVIGINQVDGMDAAKKEKKAHEKKQQQARPTTPVKQEKKETADVKQDVAVAPGTPRRASQIDVEVALGPLARHIEDRRDSSTSIAKLNQRIIEGLEDMLEKDPSVNDDDVITAVKEILNQQDINAPALTNKHGTYSLLQDAAKKGHSLLLRTYVKMGGDIHKTDAQNNTLLHLSAGSTREGSADIIFFLLTNTKKGLEDSLRAEINQENNAQKTALDIACEHEKIATVRILKEFGAKHGRNGTCGKRCPCKLYSPSCCIIS